MGLMGWPRSSVVMYEGTFELRPPQMAGLPDGVLDVAPGAMPGSGISVGTVALGPIKAGVLLSVMRAPVLVWLLVVSVLPPMTLPPLSV